MFRNDPLKPLNGVSASSPARCAGRKAMSRLHLRGKLHQQLHQSPVPNHGSRSRARRTAFTNPLPARLRHRPTRHARPDDARHRQFRRQAKPGSRDRLVWRRGHEHDPRPILRALRDRSDRPGAGWQAVQGDVAPGGQGTVVHRFVRGRGHLRASRGLR